MSEAKRFIRNIIDPIDYQMSKLPTFKSQSEGTVTKFTASNSNAETETVSVFIYQESNQRQSDRTIVVSG